MGGKTPPPDAKTATTPTGAGADYTDSKNITQAFKELFNEQAKEKLEREKELAGPKLAKQIASANQS